MLLVALILLAHEIPNRTGNVSLIEVERVALKMQIYLITLSGDYLIYAKVID